MKMPSARLIFMFLALSWTPSVFAGGGSGSDAGNGGDIVVAEFLLYTDALLERLSNDPRNPSATLDLTPLLETRRSLIVVSKSHTFLRGAEVDAVNYPSELLRELASQSLIDQEQEPQDDGCVLRASRLLQAQQTFGSCIEVSRSRWDDIANSDDRKLVLAFHELMGAASLGDFDFSMSIPLLTYFRENPISIARPVSPSAIRPDQETLVRFTVTLSSPRDLHDNTRVRLKLSAPGSSNFERGSEVQLMPTEASTGHRTFVGETYLTAQELRRRLYRIEYRVESGVQNVECAVTVQSDALPAYRKVFRGQVGRDHFGMGRLVAN